MDKIAVMDFGGQYAHLIATRIRRQGVYAEILPEETTAEELRSYKGLILSGGPQSVYETDSPRCQKEIFSLGIPILGICYGHQYLNWVLGGEVKAGKVKEYGPVEVELDETTPLFKDLQPGTKGSRFQVWMSHGDEVTKPAPGFFRIGNSRDCEFAALACPEKNLYGVQFHPEVTHTLQGESIIANFVFRICGAKPSWSLGAAFLAEKIAAIREQAGSRKVFLLVSGGVDSTVAFALIARAIGNDRVYGLFVDTGFLRSAEEKTVAAALREIGVNLHVYDAKADFYANLKGVSDPEQKRVIIGDTFLTIKDRVAAELQLLSGEWLLGQGTIYPDTIESGGSKRAAKIKTHHNRVDKILHLKERGLLIEPLSDLYKDEVRQLGELLGLPSAMVWRHPFPGPGLAVRCLCAGETVISPEEKDLAEAVRAVDPELKTLEAINLFPLKSVGVQGDDRSYKEAAIINAAWRKNLARPDFWSDIKMISPLITNKFREFNRVLLLLEPEKIISLAVISRSYLTPERIAVLQAADKIVTELLETHKLYDQVWQFPVVLAPVAVNGRLGESVILRPVLSTEAMTAEFAVLPPEFLLAACAKIRELPGVGAIFFDITNKPPATIEWE